ncbi:MAG: 2-keto-3-deoxy-L-rhamnonate aldolase RhmA [Glaciecola sp.]|jgi:2-keto-3-deoxy-L-rhamnonate aldolase RhmA
MLATFVMIPRIEIVELLGANGFDAVVLDLEHGPLEVADLAGLSAAAQRSGMFAIARLASDDESTIARALDSGVDGVVVPHVGSAEAAAHVVSSGRFPPVGHRSLNPFVRGARYGLGDEAGRDPANNRAAIIAMLEGADALRNLDAICATVGLDALFVGPVDLSAALGVPGQPEHPTVVEAVQDVFRRLATAGVAGGIYAHTPEAAYRWAAAGASLTALSADIAMVAQGFAAMQASLRELGPVIPARANVEL